MATRTRPPRPSSPYFRGLFIKSRPLIYAHLPLRDLKQVAPSPFRQDAGEDRSASGRPERPEGGRKIRPDRRGRKIRPDRRGRKIAGDAARRSAGEDRAA